MMVDEKIIDKLSIGSYGFFGSGRMALEFQFQPSVSELEVDNWSKTKVAEKKAGQKPENKKIYDDTSAEDKQKKAKQDIDEAIINAKVADEAEKMQMFKNGVTGAERELKQGLDQYYDKSVINGIDGYIKNIEALLEKYKEKIKNHKS